MEKIRKISIGTWISIATFVVMLAGIGFADYRGKIYSEFVQKQMQEDIEDLKTSYEDSEINRMDEKISTLRKDLDEFKEDTKDYMKIDNERHGKTVDYMLRNNRSSR